jgi:hypothetical protein
MDLLLMQYMSCHHVYMNKKIYDIYCAMSLIIHETHICIVSTYVVLGSTDRTSETRIIDPVRLIRGLRITRFSTIHGV